MSYSTLFSVLWSRSSSCSQVRAAHCMVRLHNTTQNVDSSLCEDAGLPVPPTLQKCGTEDCPHWVPSDWSPCEESRCFTWNTGSLLSITLVNIVFYVGHISVRPVFSVLMKKYCSFLNLDKFFTIFPIFFFSS